MAERKEKGVKREAKIVKQFTDTGSRDKKQKQLNKLRRGSHETKLAKLKKVVIRTLKKHPEGVNKIDIWTLVFKETGLRVSAKDYGVSKMANVFEKWTDVIRSNDEKLFLIDEQSSEENTNKLRPERMEEFDQTAEHDCMNQEFDMKAAETENIMFEADTDREERDNEPVSFFFQPGTDFHQPLKPDSSEQILVRTKQTEDLSKNDLTFGVFSEYDETVDEKNERTAVKTAIDELLGESDSALTVPVDGQRAKSLPSWADIATVSKQPTLTRSEVQSYEKSLQAPSQQAVPSHTNEELKINAAQTERLHQFQGNSLIFNTAREPNGLFQLHSQTPEMRMLDPSQIEKPVQRLHQPPGVHTNAFGQMLFPAQMQNRFQVPIPSQNQFGVFPFYRPPGLSLFGAPLTYRVPAPPEQQLRQGNPAHVNQIFPLSQEKTSVEKLSQTGELNRMQTIGGNPYEPNLSFTAPNCSRSSSESPHNEDTLKHVEMSDSTSNSPSFISSPVSSSNRGQFEARNPLPAWTRSNEPESKLAQARMPSPVPQLRAQNTNEGVWLSAAGNQMTMPKPPMHIKERPLTKETPVGYRGIIPEYHASLADRNKQQQTLINQFVGTNLDKWQPFTEDVKQLAFRPIDKDEFKSKFIDVRPVYVQPGKQPSSEQVDNVAKECIEMLADANEFVTPERVEKLVCQRFCCNVIHQLGVNHIDQIPCVNDHNRLISKINAYITAFLKTRSICTLYELKEALRAYVPDNGDFTMLKTGPLQRFPVVFHNFRFPPDLAEIPEITSMDILEHFNNYLTINRLWVNSKLELEPFMEYLVKEYNADNAYMLGVRIRSLPLAIGVLKKAKRDSAACHREIKDHFEENLKTEIGDAFRKFRTHILQTGDDKGMEVRKHYLKMKPEIVIMEMFDKFNVLLAITQDRRLTRPTMYRRVIEDFLTIMREDDLGRNLVHLAICMSNTAVEETVQKMLTLDDDDDDDTNEKQTHHKPPPRKDALVGSLKTYIERCLNAGGVSLVHLSQIERKMLEDFGFPDFNMIGYGRFLEFLLLEETKQILEESVGLHLGTDSAGGDSETSFKPHQLDLMEFIKQCRQQDKDQPERVEEALCAHYNVKKVRDLGHGNIGRLLNYAEKHGRHMLDQFSVYYESALVQTGRFTHSSEMKVGMLGHQTREAAKICLHNCPLLENMADWSQWSLVFEPELGKLKDFVQKYGGVTTKTIEGGKVVTLDFLALEVQPGELVKIVSSTGIENVIIALKHRDVKSTAGHLVSMAVSHKGIDNMPLALIARHIMDVLLQLNADEPRGAITGFPFAQNTAAVFVLQCLVRIPTRICVSLANQVFLEPLGHVLGSSKSKQMLVKLCRTELEISHLIQLGCLLGIQEWTNVMQLKCQLSDTAVQDLPMDFKEFFGNDPYQDEEEVEMFDELSDREDVDDILEGGLSGEDDDVSKESVSKEIEERSIEDETEAEETKTEIANSYECEGEQKEDESKSKKEESSCEAVVNQIRRDEFGVGVQLSEDGQRLMKVQQERLGRSLDRLSKDLYSKDTHFVLELIQNADDNNYSENLLDGTKDDCPSVKFVIEHEVIYVLNNELGFREKDIRALCDVGRSTKGKHKFGYIGQKGIGFKSVFRITDEPEVHSNGYHIKFDVKNGPMGYILPHWLSEDESSSKNEWMTHIILKLKRDMRLQTRTLAARFNDIHPSLLLFLHRLRQITIENKVENSVQTMRRRDVGDNIVEIKHTHGTERWLVIRKMLDASKISIQTKSGTDVESTEIALAFPIQKQGTKSTVQEMPQKQPVFAFLPLRSYGFRFIIQGDFDVPSSREDVDKDSYWNQWLRNEIHKAFIECLDTFKSHPEFSCVEAICAFLKFVPMEDEVLDFFKPVASDILKKLKSKQCVPTQAGAEEAICWRMPSQAVRVRDPLVRSVITAKLLEEHLNLFYLHSDVASMMNPALASCLGIETLTSDHLFQLGKALIVNMGTHCSKEENIVLISKWMACLYRSLDEFHQDDMILDTLKSSRMFPLSDGEFVSLNDKAVFFPLKHSTSKRHKGKDQLYCLQQDIKSVHPLLLNTDDDEVNSQVQKLLLRLGVKQLSPFDVINHHILPVLKSDLWKSKNEETLVSYLVFIKEQTEKQASVCNMNDVKDVVLVLTNQGFKNPSLEPVHFPPQYGNQINLQEVFSGYDWTLLDTCYLPSICTHAIIMSWQKFFKQLGVEEFLSFRKKEIQMKRENLKESIWRDLGDLLPQQEEEIIIQDNYSAEVEGLITNNHCESDCQFADQMRHLFTYLDRFWDSRYSKHCKCEVKDKDGNKLKDIESSFSILLRTSEWVPAIETVTTVDSGFVKREVHFVVKKPSCLYVKSDVVQNLLFDKVLFLNAQTVGGSFCQFLGIKNSVEVKTVTYLLLQWSERKEENTPSLFCTTLQHMTNVYMYLCAQLTRQEFQNLLQENPVFFVPNENVSNFLNAKATVVPGKMLNRKEIWLSDRTGLFAKHRRVLEEFHSEVCNKATIVEFYGENSEVTELFKQEAKLDVQPKVDEYIKLLTLLCNTNSPKNAAVLNDILYILSTVGEIMVTPPVGLPGGQAANSALEALKMFVKAKLKREKVFPTNKHVWVSLEDKPMIADNKEWEKLFADKPDVHFLDMLERSNKKSRSTRVSSKQRGKTDKDFDSHIRPEMVNVVIEACGIKKLSDCVEIRPTPEMLYPCPEMQKYFSQIVPSLQHYLMAKFEDVYQVLEQTNVKQLLADAKFYQCGQLEVSYWLPNMATDTFTIQQEKCNIHPPEFYFHREHISKTVDINKEIARYFSQGDADCSNLLRSFLSELFNIISGVSEETEENLLQRYDVGDTEVPEEEKWNVEAPAVQEPEKPEENVAVQEEDVTEEEKPDVPVTQEEQFVIRAWPPVANPNRTQNKATSEMPASNLWPPPQGKEYMRSVKELPSNIRMVVPGSDSEDTLQNPVVVGDTDKNILTGIAQCPVPDNINMGQNIGMFTIKIESGDSKTDVNMQAGQSRNISSDGHLREAGGPANTSAQATKSERQTAMMVPSTGEVAAIDSNWEIDHNHSVKSGSPEATRHQGTFYQQNGDRKRPVISGIPFWGDMATEYAYDELGSGKDICVIDNLTLTDGVGDAEIGQWGEALVAHYLERQKELGKIHDFMWKNETGEAGSPFDFEIELKLDGGIYKHYIEVKSTASENKEVFEISVQQVKFANQMKSQFHIFRVFNAGNPEKVKLIRISNLDMRLSTKQVKLCMLI